MAIAIERKYPKGNGRVRIAVILNAQAPTLRAFPLENVELGSIIITDGLKSYPAAVGNDLTHKPFNMAGSGPIRAVERAEAQHDYSTWCVRQRRGASSARPECKGT